MNEIDNVFPIYPAPPADPYAQALRKALFETGITEHNWDFLMNRFVITDIGKEKSAEEWTKLFCQPSMTLPTFHAAMMFLFA